MTPNKKLLAIVGLLLVVSVWAVAFMLLVARPNASSNIGDLPTQAKLPALTPSLTVAAPNSAVLALNPTAPPAPSSDNRLTAITPVKQVEAPRDPVPNQVLIQFAPNTTSAQRDDYVRSIGGTVNQTIAPLNIVSVTLSQPLTSLPSSPIVTTSEPDYYVTAQTDVVTSDPYIAQQWALPIIDAAAGWQALPAGGTLITVAVIDSGVCTTHPDLAGRLLDGWDYVQNDATPQDEYGHGCQVTGIIAANGDNAIGIAGVAPNTHILPLRVLDAQGTGTYSNVAAAIVRAADSGAQIINLSLGGYSPSTALESAVLYATSRGVVVIAAAGNTGTPTVLYPAAYTPVIAVGAVDQNLQRTSFSSYGPKVDVFAPGQDILTTTTNGSYAPATGTSFASPQVAGIAALEMAHGRSVRLGGIIHYTGSQSPTSTPTPTNTPTPPPQATDPITGRPQSQQTPPVTVVTDTWAVQLTPGADADAMAASLGFENLGRIGELQDIYLFRLVGSGSSAQAAASALEASAQVVWFAQQIAVQQTPRTPPDPLYPNQWHLKNIGQSGGTAGQDTNVEPAWNAGFIGTGSQIAIVDDGLQYSHPDISPNYNAADSYDFNNSDFDPYPEAFPHGTAAAGVAAGAANGSTANVGFCGVGAAYNAKVSGVRLIAGPSSDAMEASALNYHYDQNHIFSNSWGPSDNGTVLAGPGTLTLQALENGVTSGRSNKGNIYVWAAGNGKGNSDNVNADGYANSRFVIAVGAVDFNGVSSWYSEPGAPMLVTAPSSGNTVGITTSDLLGANGYNGYPSDLGCTNGFGGTSSAAPLVSGIVALILQANPNLTWRDVQHILVRTAVKNDPTNADWTTNAAGYHINHFYGFGRVDAAAAVNLATTWTNVGAELSAASPVINVNQAIPDGLAAYTPGAPVISNFTMTDDVLVEHVEVVFSATHPFRGDLLVTLISPSGTRSELMTIRPNDSSDNYTNWTFSTVRNWGESSAGTWSIEVRDSWNTDTGIFNSWQLKVYGTVPTPPPNDNVANAFTINTLPYLDRQLTTSATSEVTDPTPACATGVTRTAWYTYTATANETIRFNTSSAIFDTVLSVWSGSPGSFVAEGCDNGTGNAAFVQVPVTSGTTYYIMVGGSVGTGGVVSFYASKGITADLLVTSTDDTSDGTCDTTHCSLREAINTSNATGGVQTIGFNLPNIGINTIVPGLLFPTISQPVIIDGTTQAGYFTTPIVELRGGGGASDGLVISGGSSIVKGLVINLFPSNAISLRDFGGNVIQGNYIGTDISGNSARPNFNGIFTDTNANGNTIGGITPGSGNLISGNSGCGICLQTNNNVIQGNTIGTNVSGTTNVSNDAGIRVTNGSQFNLIGGTTPAARNVISGNDNQGLYIDSYNTTVQGNYIGLNTAGTAALPNRIGIELTGSANTTIGGIIPGAGNVISGNVLGGVKFTSGSSNVVQGNFIGTDPTGMIAFGNGSFGIDLESASNTIGGTTLAARNIISGNQGYGILLATINAHHNTLQGNFIGVNASGMGALPNTGQGILISNTAKNNTVGGASPGAGNVISGNTGNGIYLAGSSTTDNFIQGNFIGTNAAGSGALPNSLNGIFLEIGATANTIGGTVVGAGNVISGNVVSGIRLASGASNNTLQGNFIGTDTSGTLSLGNGLYGINVEAFNTTIGGTLPGAGNTIAFNNSHGVYIKSPISAVRVNRNLLYSNVGLGLSLPSGANSSLPAPIFDSAATTLTGDTIISGTLVALQTSPPPYRVEFFSNTTCDTSAFGEGQLFLGALDNVDTAITPTFSATLTGVTVPDGSIITMTVTSSTGDTSAFSKCPPKNPTALSATGVSQGQINLTWTDAVPDETNFRVERSPDGSTGWTEIATLSAGTTSHANNQLTCGSTYYYRVRAYRDSDSLFSAYSTITTASTQACPPNDNFSGAISINPASLPYTDTQNNEGITVEAGEPAPSCGTNTGHTLWYAITPAVSGRLWLWTSNTTFDSLISVWTGTALNDLIEAACDNDSGLGDAPYLDIPVTGGTTYYLLLSANNNSYGDVTFKVSLPIPTATPVPTNTPTAIYTPLPNATSHIGLFKNGVWSMSNTTASGFPDMVFAFGPQEAGWTPIAGNWDGDLQQVDTVGLYKDGVFWLRDTNGGGFADLRFSFGEAGWQPLAGDWNNDHTDTIGVYKNGEFRLKNTNGAGFPTYTSGLVLKKVGWTAIAGDWNGDGTDTIGLYKNGEFWLKNTNTEGLPDLRFTVNLGSATFTGWLPVVGDWDRDGLDTIGLVNNGIWWLKNSFGYGFADQIVMFGKAEPGWLPIAGRWDGALPLGIPITPPNAPPTATLMLPPTLTPTDAAPLTATPTISPTETPVPATETATPTAIDAPLPSETATDTPTETPLPTATDVLMETPTDTATP